MLTNLPISYDLCIGDLLHDYEPSDGPFEALVVSSNPAKLGATLLYSECSDASQVATYDI